MAKQFRGIKLSNSDNVNSMAFTVAPKAIEKQLEKAVKSGNSGNSMIGLHIMEDTPSGCLLFTYWLAVMTVLGGFTPARNSMPIKTIRSLFKSASVISHHTANGNLEKVNSESIRLTITGWNYFSGRLNGTTHGQKVDEKDLNQLAELIKNGGPGFRAI